MTQSEIDSANEAVLYWVSLAGASIPPTQSGMDEAEEAGREALERLCEAAKPAEDLVGRRVRYPDGTEGRIRRGPFPAVEVEYRERGIGLTETVDLSVLEFIEGGFDLLPDAPEDERREP